MHLPQVALLEAMVTTLRDRLQEEEERASTLEANLRSSRR